MNFGSPREKAPEGAPREDARGRPAATTAAHVERIWARAADQSSSGNSSRSHVAASGRTMSRLCEGDGTSEPASIEEKTAPERSEGYVRESLQSKGAGHIVTSERRHTYAEKAPSGSRHPAAPRSGRAATKKWTAKAVSRPSPANRGRDTALWTHAGAPAPSATAVPPSATAAQRPPTPKSRRRSCRSRASKAASEAATTLEEGSSVRRCSQDSAPSRCSTQ